MQVKSYKSKRTNLEDVTFEEFVSNYVESNRVKIIEDETVMACVSAISTHIASMSMRLYLKEGDNKKLVKNELSEVLERPHYLYSDYEFIKVMVQEMLLYGESFAVCRFKGGKLIFMEPLTNSTLSERVVGSGTWIVQGNKVTNGEAVTERYENCIHFKDNFKRTDILRGIVGAKCVASELIDKTFNQNLSHDIKGIVELQGTASRETKIEIKKAFNEVLRSEEDSVAVVDSTYGYKPVTASRSSFKDSQVVEICQRLDDKIHQVLNVPKVITSIGDGNSYNVSESLIVQFIQSLLPLVKMIEKEMTYKLLTTIERANMYVKFDYRSLMRANDNTRADYYTKMINNGVYSVNDVLKLEDMDVIEGGDYHHASLNYVPIEKWLEYIQIRYELKGGENNEKEVL